MHSTSSVAPDAFAPDSTCFCSESTRRALSGVLASFAGLLRNIGYAGALAPPV